jgi:hypothetical protein
MKHIYINKLNEWNISAYTVIITHDNISTTDLYTGVGVNWKVKGVSGVDRIVQGKILEVDRKVGDKLQ